MLSKFSLLAIALFALAAVAFKGTPRDGKATNPAERLSDFSPAAAEWWRQQEVRELSAIRDRLIGERQHETAIEAGRILTELRLASLNADNIEAWRKRVVNFKIGTLPTKGY